MSDSNNPWGGPAVQTAAVDMSVDAGLRRFMLGVYNKLCLGLILAGALAWVVGNVPEVTRLFFEARPDGRVGLTILGMVVQWAPLVMLLVASFTMRSPTARGASLLYWAVVASFGASLGFIFLVYAQTSIAMTFFITAASFGSLSLWGYTTKRDISAWGSFLFMGLIGIIIAMVVNLFLHNAMMDFVISIIGVLIFAGFTAYDTQKLKIGYAQLKDNQAALSVMTSWGALNLFLDFINMFLFLLRIFGGGRR